MTLNKQLICRITVALCNRDRDREYHVFFTFIVKQVNCSHYSDQLDMFQTIQVHSQVPPTSHKLLQNLALV